MTPQDARTAVFMNLDSEKFARYDFQPRHADFNQRVVENTETSGWSYTDTSGVSFKLIESVRTTQPRLTLLIRFEPGSSYDLHQHYGGAEFLLLDGTLHDEHTTYEAGYYIRNPEGSVHVPRSDTGCLLFVKLGEFAEADKEHRVISTLDSSDWLPGPVDGTEVLALHMHGNRSVLMLRWRESATFKPGLDPQGEEIFVVGGQLSDEHGVYPPLTWIRNPIPAWQAWSGERGTLVYYKNGHFPAELVSNNDSPDDNPLAG